MDECMVWQGDCTARVHTVHGAKRAECEPEEADQVTWQPLCWDPPQEWALRGACRVVRMDMQLCWESGFIWLACDWELVWWRENRCPGKKGRWQFKKPQRPSGGQATVVVALQAYQNKSATQTHLHVDAGGNEDQVHVPLSGHWSKSFTGSVEKKLQLATVELLF